jgi:hypothetical protein
MATRILLVSLFLCLLTACDKKEDDNNPGKDYTGKLTLTFSRSFPTYQAVVPVEVLIAANGSVTLTPPAPIAYTGIAEKMLEGKRIKISEEGVVNISGLSGNYVRKDGKDFLEVNITCTLDGVQTVWTYDGICWTSPGETPYTLANPVQCPMCFRIGSALMSEAVCGANCCDAWGNACFRWRLVLR